jgi:hypothetical protein
MSDISTFTWTPKGMNQADSIPWLTLQKGQLVTDAWLWVDQPSDNGSSGQVGVSGDTYSIFALANQVGGDLFGGANPSVTDLLNGNHSQVVSAACAIALTWTPGGSPGATAPRFILKVVTEQLF